MQTAIRIRGYDSLEQIAIGGMAVVYKARKQSLKKTVAIKVLLPHLSADNRFITRFQQEAEAAARIQHDNIVNVLDYGKSDDSYYIVMEYYDGMTVEELLRSQPQLPIDIALSVLLKISSGLEAAHAQRLVHRDIKPANIILTRQGGVKIADFGLAKSVEKFLLVTHAGKVVGTPAYMSPEQTRGETVGTASDIFSLGVVAYELLTSKRPFEGSSYSEVVDRIQSYEPPAVRSLNPLVDVAFEAIVVKMLAKSLDRRYPRMSDVILDLESAMEARGIKSNARSLAEFFNDPVGYAASRPTPPPLRSEPAPTAGVGDTGVGDTGAKGFLHRLGIRGKSVASSDEAGAATGSDPAAIDPATDCRVILESIDRLAESEDTFALRLAMRLKAPVPRIRSLVSRTPCTLAPRLSYVKAKKLVRAVEELGGKATIEPLDVPKAPAPETKPAARPIPEKVRAEQPAPEPEAPPSSRTPTPEPMAPPRRSAGMGGIVCPRCGWEEDSTARFCSVCNYSFNKTQKIEVRAVGRPGFENPRDNPLVTPVTLDGTRSAPTIHASTGSHRLALYIGGALLLLPIVVLLLKH
jgi:tRNA A-37 threonylcarbamoyl transferase component Bud32